MAFRLSVCASILKPTSHHIAFVMFQKCYFFGGGGGVGYLWHCCSLFFIFVHLFVVTAVQRECMLTMHCLIYVL